MKVRLSRAGFVALSLTMSLEATVEAHGVAIARDADGALQIHVDAHQPIQLGPSIYPGILGFADAEPGITALETEEPDEGLFLLDFDSNIEFELVGTDPGIQIVTDHIWSPGETFNFGPPFFDYHLIFNIPMGEIGTIYEIQFRVRDLNGILSDSDIATLRFTPVVTVCHCRGDLNDDDELAGTDVRAFVECLLNSGAGQCECADMNGDGTLDDEDVEHFVEHLVDGVAC